MTKKLPRPQSPIAKVSFGINLAPKTSTPWLKYYQGLKVPSPKWALALTWLPKLPHSTKILPGPQSRIAKVSFGIDLAPKTSTPRLKYYQGLWPCAYFSRGVHISRNWPVPKSILANQLAVWLHSVPLMSLFRSLSFPLCISYVPFPCVRCACLLSLTRTNQRFKV